MNTRPLVGVQSGVVGAKVEQHVKTPVVFQVPIRPDLVNDVFARMNKNRRQAHSVSKFAGHQTSAESWGTGRAVARIPRVPGGGTHRAGQGAFGNMCRGGRMFAPTKTWRRWHRKINITEKRHALASAIAASAIPALVMARGHRIEQVAEIPLVIDNKAIDNLDKTKSARALLKTINAADDLRRVTDSKKLRNGKGKMRNRRTVQRRGPLVIFNNKGPLVKAFRNIPGIELCSVNHLNLLQLAPGGHLGRFCIWTKDAFEKLDTIYGTYKRASIKEDYKLPRTLMTTADLNKVINSDEIQSAIRGKKQVRPIAHKRNPLKNMQTLAKLNPYAIARRRQSIVAEEQRQKKRAELLENQRKGVKVEYSADEKKKFAARKTALKMKKTAAYKKNILAH